MDNIEPKRGQIWSFLGKGWKCLGLHASMDGWYFRSVKRDGEGRHWYLISDNPIARGMTLIEDRRG